MYSDPLGLPYTEGWNKVESKGRQIHMWAQIQDRE